MGGAFHFFGAFCYFSFEVFSVSVFIYVDSRHFAPFPVRSAHGFGMENPFALGLGECGGHGPGDFCV